MKITKPQLAGMLAIANSRFDWELLQTSTRRALLRQRLISHAARGGYIVTQHGIEQLRMRGHVAAVSQAELAD